MRTVSFKTVQWDATYSESQNAYETQDGLIGRFLNDLCVPESADADDAVELVQAQFPTLVIETLIASDQ